ncbi:MAG: ATP-binding cassette domain-containing protein, partial [Myxococcales bacterium]|nr:ATP-binding cassette domain-containing protein [Myxococcales bacterium]
PTTRARSRPTLLNIIGGLDSDYEGAVEVEGKRLHEMTDLEASAYRNNHVGFVFQSFHLFDYMSCLENVMLPSLFDRKGGAAADARARALDLLDQVGIAEKASQPPMNLSGGQKQRVAIARALFNRPSMMICDEPTGNLDRRSGDAILELFRALNQDDRITLLIVTHDPLIADAATRCVRIEDGQVREDSGASVRASDEDGGADGGVDAGEGAFEAEERA